LGYGDTGTRLHVSPREDFWKLECDAAELRAMSRNHEKLKVFGMADELAVAVYRATTTFPVEERFALQSQIRRAAVSVPTNIVEGAARRTGRDYLKFLDISLGSATEVRYLISLSSRLQLMPAATAESLEKRYTDLLRALQSLIANLSACEGA